MGNGSAAHVKADTEPEYEQIEVCRMGSPHPFYVRGAYLGRRPKRTADEVGNGYHH